MRLTNFSDLSFRVLIYAAAFRSRLITIDEVHGYLGVSRGHLMKVVNNLSRKGLLRSVRGRQGGLTLAKEPAEIRLSDIVQSSETDFAQVECMRADGSCVMTPFCKLPAPLNEAMAAYMSVLDGYTLADIDISSRIPGADQSSAVDEKIS